MKKYNFFWEELKSAYKQEKKYYEDMDGGLRDIDTYNFYDAQGLRHMIQYWDFHYRTQEEEANELQHYMTNCEWARKTMRGYYTQARNIAISMGYTRDYARQMNPMMLFIFIQHKARVEARKVARELFLRKLEREGKTHKGVNILNVRGECKSA